MVCADWIIDLGPGAGDEGGRVVAEGTPEADRHELDGHRARSWRRRCVNRAVPVADMRGHRCDPDAARCRLVMMIEDESAKRAGPRGRSRRYDEPRSGGYSGPLEQVGPCQWRIPEELPRRHARRRPDLRRRDADRADQEGPGARAGRQRRHAARHPEGQPGHARHPLGLRLLHRRRRRHRPGGRGRDLARAASATTSTAASGCCAPNLDWNEVKDRIRPLVDQLFRDIPTGVGQSGQVPVRQAEADAADGARLGLRRRPGLGDRARPRLHRGRRPARRRRPRPGQRPRLSRAATTSAARSARATTSSKSRSSIASSTRRRPR